MRALLLLAMLLCPDLARGGVPPPGQGVSADEEARILRTIGQRTRRFMARHDGIADQRRVLTSEYDASSGLLLKTTLTEQDVVHHFYTRPDLTIRRCVIDGRPLPPKRCIDEHQRMLPHIPVFDRHGPQNYQLRVGGTTTVDGQLCYRVIVHPRKNTPRHFKGQLLFRVRDLLLLRMEGTVAKLPFPVTHLVLKLTFRKYNEDLVAVSRGYIDVWIHVPLVLRRRIVTRYTAHGQRAVARPP